MPVESNSLHNTDPVKTVLYNSLKEHATLQPNSEWVARMLVSWLHGTGSLPGCMGLENQIAFHEMLNSLFPGVSLSSPTDKKIPDSSTDDERNELKELFLKHRAHRDDSEIWIADILTAACLAGDHLWQDLGLWSREDLSTMLEENFPTLAEKNDKDMKWKKFFYRQLCTNEGKKACRSPSCETCVDYEKCFGPE